MANDYPSFSNALKALGAVPCSACGGDYRLPDHTDHDAELLLRGMQRPIRPDVPPDNVVRLDEYRRTDPDAAPDQDDGGRTEDAVAPDPSAEQGDVDLERPDDARGNEESAP